jgi:ketosteroid isomerase-like protein
MSQEHIKHIFATLDTLQVEDFAAFFTEDGQMRNGNAAPIVGRSSIRDTFEQGFKPVLKALHHEIIGLWEEDDVVIVESIVHYTRKDDRIITLPAVSILRMAGDNIREYRVYMDIGPVFA